MHNLSSTLFVSLAVVATLGGCGGSTESSKASSPPPIPRDQFLARYAAAICDNVGSCCQGAGLTYSAAGCKDSVSIHATAVVADGKVNYDPQQAGACVSWLTDVAQSCSQPTEATSPCDGVFSGTVPNGGACAADDECRALTQGGATCQSGVCVQESHGRLGDACSETCDLAGRVCWATASAPSATCYVDDGLVCGSSGRCETAPGVGAACVDACATGAFCDPQTSVCASLVAAGSGCTSSEQCQSGTFCNGTTGKCAAEHAPGASCQTDRECASSVCDAGKCTGGLASPLVCSGTTSAP